MNADVPHAEALPGFLADGHSPGPTSPVVRLLAASEMTISPAADSRFLHHARRAWNAAAVRRVLSYAEPAAGVAADAAGRDGTTPGVGSNMNRP
jgi:hypothetical protein